MPSHQPANRDPRRWAFFAVISLGLVMVAVDNSILYTALPALNRELGATQLQSLWIINAYPLALTGLLLGTGTLGDRIGHRRMFLIGLGIFGVASLAAAFAPSAWALVAARGVLGVGAAAMMPATLALIFDIFTDEQERNVAVGIWGSGAVLGAAIGPVVGGALLEVFWWGSVFLINVPLVALAAAGTLLYGTPNRPNPAKRWDLVSSLYALVTLSGLTTAIKEATYPDRNPVIIASAGVALVAGAVAFTRRQNRLADPLLTFDLFRSRIFAGGVLAAVGSMFVLIGMEMTATQRLQLVEGFTPFQAGLAVAVVALASFPFSLAGGALLRRMGFLAIIGSGFLADVAGALISWWGSTHDNTAVLIAGFLVLGAGSSFIMSVSSTAIIGAAPPERSGMAAGIEEVSYEFGTLVTVAMTGSLLSAVFLADLPAGLSERGIGALYDVSTHAAAAPAYADAHETVILFLAATALVCAAVSARCFRGNPRSALPH